MTSAHVKELLKALSAAPEKRVQVLLSTFREGGQEEAALQAADNMAEAMICLVNLSNLAWKATFAGDPLKDTRLRMERARSLGLKRQDG